MTLIPELDYKQTRDNARNILKSCRSLQRRSGMTVTLQSPVLSDMPRNQSNRNNVEHGTIKKLEKMTKWHIEDSRESRYKIQSIVSALKSLPEVSRNILYYSYCVANPYSVVKLSNTIKIYREGEHGCIQDITYSPKSIERLKSDALIEFAEAYRCGELLMYKK